MPDDQGNSNDVSAGKTMVKFNYNNKRREYLIMKSTWLKWTLATMGAAIILSIIGFSVFYFINMQNGSSGPIISEDNFDQDHAAQKNDWEDLLYIDEDAQASMAGRYNLGIFGGVADIADPMNIDSSYAGDAIFFFELKESGTGYLYAEDEKGTVLGSVRLFWSAIGVTPDILDGPESPLAAELGPFHNRSGAKTFYQVFISLYDKVPPFATEAPYIVMQLDAGKIDPSVLSKLASTASPDSDVWLFEQIDDADGFAKVDNVGKLVIGAVKEE